MNPYSKLILFLLLFICNRGYSQFILAGITGPNDIYADVIPDDSLYAYCPVGSTWLVRKDIDLDDDGTTDVSIQSGGGGGLGGQTCFCLIKPLNNIASIRAKDLYLNGFWITAADTLNFGDSISASGGYKGESFMYHDVSGYQLGPTLTFWNNIGDHYIGVRLLRAQETLYGWIRFEAETYGGFYGIVKDYACNRGIHTVVYEKNVGYYVAVYPDPAQAIMHIKCNRDFLFTRHISVIASTGDPVYQSVLLPGQTEIPVVVASWPAGLYLVRIESNGKVVTRRVVILHE